jgi:DNA repair exonuclease SbcCD ATPase subunit
MKITKIQIDSLYGIKHLELDGKPIEIRGIKGAGKTSVIDSIRYALTNRSNRAFIVKQGEQEGEILIQTDTGISIDRKKRTDTGDYAKITEHGKPVQSPQSFINEIFTPLQLNPVEFASWDEKTQNREILNLIEFEWDMDWIKEQFGEIPRGINYEQHILQVLEDIQAKNGDYWKRREDCNRKELYKRQQLSDIANKIPKGYDLKKWQSFDVKEKSFELQKAQKHNSEIERATAFIVAYNNKVRGLQADRDMAIAAEETAINTERNSLTSTIERLKAEIKAAEDKLTTLDEKLSDKKKVIEAEFNEAKSKLDGDIKIAAEYKDKQKIETSEIESELNEAIEMKEYISEYNSMLSMKTECEELKAESEALTEKIQLARNLPGKVLETATIPIEGLTVKNGLPLINGLPISNLSDGEQIELCVDITLAQKHKLEIILINGAEALDDVSRENLYKKCKDKGLQIIAARTTNDSEFTIVEL